MRTRPDFLADRPEHPNLDRHGEPGIIVGVTATPARDGESFSLFALCHLVDALMRQPQETSRITGAHFQFA